MASKDSFDHTNPHGAAFGSSKPNLGMGRASAGTFTSNPGPHMAPGGHSEHGTKQSASLNAKGGKAPLKGGKGPPVPNTAAGSYVASSAGGSGSPSKAAQPYDSDGDDWL
jgi:hypothetical protein